MSWGRKLSNLTRRKILEEELSYGDALGDITSALRYGVGGALEVVLSGKKRAYGSLTELKDRLNQHFNPVRLGSVKGVHELYRGGGYDQHYYDLDFTGESGYKTQGSSVSIRCRTRTPENEGTPEDQGT